MIMEGMVLPFLDDACCVTAGTLTQPYGVRIWQSGTLKVPDYR